MQPIIIGIVICNPYNSDVLITSLLLSILLLAPNLNTYNSLSKNNFIAWTILLLISILLLLYIYQKIHPITNSKELSRTSTIQA